jgi:RNA polymerase sigma-70 factor (ECF subfamily)
MSSFGFQGGVFCSAIASRPTNWFFKSHWQFRFFRQDPYRMCVSQSSDAPSTSATLLGMLGSALPSEAAWKRFVELYGPVILDWCRRSSLQDADAHDVTQETLLRLAQYLPDFHYDPNRRFRGWLRTVVHHCLCDWVEEQRRSASGTGDTAVLSLLSSLPAREALVERLEQQFDRELLEQAMVRVRQRVEPQTWRVFELLAVEQLSGEEVSRRTGMKVASAFASRSKVQRLIRREIEHLQSSWSSHC